MTILYWILLVIHIAVSVGLVLVILAQSSKGGALDGMLGGVATSTFGSQGAGDFLKKTTRIIAAAFLITSLLLAVVVRNQTTPTVVKSKSDLQSRMQEEAQQQGALDENQQAQPAQAAPAQGQQVPLTPVPAPQGK